MLRAVVPARGPEWQLGLDNLDVGALDEIAALDGRIYGLDFDGQSFCLEG